jgi:2-polyprenyl-3-methyl-5-hydroxy-6-metoxy-1,4-benzoquinol methylase
MSNIEIKINCSSFEEVFNHLNDCSGSFLPILSSYVNIEDYSKKLFYKASRIEAYSENKLIGLIGIYINSDNSFITNFSILPEFQGIGISKLLLSECILHLRKLFITKITLEVKIVNKKAINFYNKSGFKLTKTNTDNYVMELNIRDYNLECKDTQDHKYAYNFDFDVMHKYMIKSFEPFFSGRDVLELGSFKGEFTKRLLPYFDDITCIEASDEAISTAQKQLSSKVNFINSLFEDVKLDKKFNNIILTHVLEHIDDPVSLLEKINNEWLTENGKLFIVCPNANAPSRQIAVKMGLISHNTAITTSEKEHGHRITYTLDTLERDAKNANLNVIYRSGIFFKALANFQWDQLLNTDIISQQYLDGCYELGQQYPDLCSSIFLICRIKQ